MAYDLRNVSMNYFHCTNWLRTHPFLWQGKSFFIQGLAKDKNTSYKEKINYSNQILKYSYFKSPEIYLEEREEIPNSSKRPAESILLSIPKASSLPEELTCPTHTDKDNHLLTSKLSCI